MKKITFLITLILVSFSYGQTVTTTNIDNLNFETGTNSFTENGVAHGWEVSSVFPNRTVSMDLVSDPHNGTNTILSVLRGVNAKAGTTSGIKIEAESYAEVNFNPLPETVVSGGAAYILRVKVKVRASDLTLGSNFGYEIRLNGGANIIGTFSDVSSVLSTSDASWTEVSGDVTIPSTDEKRIVLFRLLLGDTILTKNETYHFDDIRFQIINPSGPTLGESIKKDLGLFVFPNPAIDILSYTQNGVSTIEIYNLLGQRILSEKATGKINISSYSKGTYMLNLIKENGMVVSKKFIKQ